jgi:hypothetical protein
LGGDTESEFGDTEIGLEDPELGPSRLCAGFGFARGVGSFVFVWFRSSGFQKKQKTKQGQK